MEAKEFRDVVHTHTPSGQQVRLVRRCLLIGAQPRGELARSRATSLRYELKGGELVEQLQDHVWLHPLTGEILHFAESGGIN